MRFAFSVGLKVDCMQGLHQSAVLGHKLEEVSCLDADKGCHLHASQAA